MKKNKAKDAINYVLNDSKIIFEIKDSKIQNINISNLILEPDVEKKVIKEIIKLLKDQKLSTPDIMEAEASIETPKSNDTVITQEIKTNNIQQSVKVEPVQETQKTSTKKENVQPFDNIDKDDDFFEMTPFEKIKSSEELKTGDIIKTKKGVNEIISIEKIENKPVAAKSEPSAKVEASDDFFETEKIETKENIIDEDEFFEEQQNETGVDKKILKDSGLYEESGLKEIMEKEIEQPKVIEDEDFW